MEADEQDLNFYCFPDETAHALFARTWAEPLETGAFFLPHARQGQVVEVAGPSGCGKSTFLLQASLTPPM